VKFVSFAIFHLLLFLAVLILYRASGSGNSVSVFLLVISAPFFVFFIADLAIAYLEPGDSHTVWRYYAGMLAIVTIVFSFMASRNESTYIWGIAVIFLAFFNYVFTIYTISIIAISESRKRKADVTSESKKSNVRDD
jgi:hypothetical protein